MASGIGARQAHNPEVVGLLGPEDVLKVETELLDAKIHLADAQGDKTASHDEVLGMFKKIVQLREEQRTLAQGRAKGGLLGPDDVWEAEIRLLGARIQLADAQGEKAAPRDAALGLFEKIVQFRERQYELTKAKYDAGVADAEAVPAAEKRLSEAKIRLAQRRGASSRGGTGQLVSPQSQPASGLVQPGRGDIPISFGLSPLGCPPGGRDRALGDFRCPARQSMPSPGFARLHAT